MHGRARWIEAVHAVGLTRRDDFAGAGAWVEVITGKNVQIYIAASLTADSHFFAVALGVVHRRNYRFAAVADA